MTTLGNNDLIKTLFQNAFFANFFFQEFVFIVHAKINCDKNRCGSENWFRSTVSDFLSYDNYIRSYRNTYRNIRYIFTVDFNRSIKCNNITDSLPNIYEMKKKERKRSCLYILYIKKKTPILCVKKLWISKKHFSDWSLFYEKYLKNFLPYICVM